jgi:hypothetical protein
MGGAFADPARPEAVFSTSLAFRSLRAGFAGSGGTRPEAVFSTSLAFRSLRAGFAGLRQAASVAFSCSTEPRMNTPSASAVIRPSWRISPRV